MIIEIIAEKNAENINMVPHLPETQGLQHLLLQVLKETT